MTRDEVTFLETGAQWIARLASARRLRRLSCRLRRSDRSATRGLLRRLLVHDVGQACVRGRKSGLRGCGRGLVGRVRQVVLEATLVGLGLFFLGLELLKLGLRTIGFLDLLRDDHAAADRKREKEHPGACEAQLKAFSRLIVFERMKLPLVLLPGRLLGKPSGRFRFEPGALNGRLLDSLELGLAPLLFESAALTLFFVRLKTGLLLLLLSTDIVEASLLVRTCTLLGFDLFLLLATLRITQNVLDGGHHRRFLPFRHGALSSFRFATTGVRRGHGCDRSRTPSERVPTCRPLCKRANAPTKPRTFDTFTLMATSVNAHITGTVWKIEVGVGDAVTAGQVCVIIESMKMEMPVEAPRAGRVETVRVAEGQAVAEGDPLLTLA